MDLRSERGEQSKIALKTAFLELFRTIDPEDISIVNLCKRAGVNRSTFYSHYGFIDCLIHEVLRENVAEVCEGLGSQWNLLLEDGGVSRTFISSYLSRFLSNPILQRFCTCSNNERYRTLIIRSQVEVSLGPDTEPVKYYTAFFQNAGVFNCVLEWMANERPIPDESIIEIIHEYSKTVSRMK